MTQLIARATAVLVSVILFGPIPVAAQTSVASLEELQRQLARGDRITVITEAGQTAVGRLERLGSDDLELRVDNKVPARRVGRLRIVTIPLDDVRSLERPRDSARNGLAIGAGIGAAFAGTMFVHAVAIDRNEMDEWAPLYAEAAAIVTGLGALIGWAVDAAHSKPRLIFDPSAPAPRISLRPMLSQRRGITVAVSF